MIGAIVFDAYGTLFDVNAVKAAAEQEFPGNGEIISRLWRQKQLEYTWLRSLMGRYVPFDMVNQDAVRYTLKALQKQDSPAAVEKLTASYLTLPPHRETDEVISALASERLVILSNGTQDMLETLVAHSNLTQYFERIISADVVKTYKPAPAVYQLAVDRLNLPPANILFVSSNGWDVAGAKSFGFQVAYVNRQQHPVEELDFIPDYIIGSLKGIPDILKNRS